METEDCTEIIRGRGKPLPYNALYKRCAELKNVRHIALPYKLNLKIIHFFAGGENCVRPQIYSYF